jgi:hypothetical protein
MSIQEALDAKMGFSSLANNNRLSLSLQWKIADVTEDALSGIPDKYDAARKVILDKFKDPSEEVQKSMPAGQIKILDANIEAFNTAMEDLGKEIVTVTFVPITYKELEAQGVKLVGRELLPLRKHFILREDEEGKKEPAAKKGGE